MFLANFIFVVSHLKIHPAVSLNTSKALTSFSSERNINQFLFTEYQIKNL